MSFNPKAILASIRKPSKKKSSERRLSSASAGKSILKKSSSFGSTVEHNCNDGGSMTSSSSSEDLSRSSCSTGTPEWSMADLDNSVMADLESHAMADLDDNANERSVFLDDPPTYSSVTDDRGNVRSEFQQRLKEVSQDGCDTEPRSRSSVNINDSCRVPIDCNMPLSTLYELDENQECLCDSPTPLPHPHLGARKSVSFGDARVFEFQMDTRSPPPYDSSGPKNLLVVLPLTVVRERLTQRQLVQLVGVMLLGAVMVSGIVLWVFSPAIF